MSSNIKINFKGNRSGVAKNIQEFHITKGEKVIIEVENGLDIATVSCTSGCCSEDEKEQFIVSRIATKTDLDRADKNRKKESDAIRFCKIRINEFNLKMHLVDAEIQFDGRKTIFFFTAEQRVDFRALVKNLASHYRTRIELRQIGVRDEAKRIDGVGACGRPQCCGSFLNTFGQITTQYAKDQQLSLNPSKISGNCGRLLCCLEYEEEQYIEAYKTLPRSGSTFINEAGVKGTIISTDIFKDRIHVRSYDKGTNSFDWYNLEEIKKGVIHEAPDYSRKR